MRKTEYGNALNSLDLSEIGSEERSLLLPMRLVLRVRLDGEDGELCDGL
jgi:hypothetical protein